MTYEEELQYIRTFAKENDMTNELAQEQLRALWTAFCFHHDLSVDTSDYEDYIVTLYLEDVAKKWSKRMGHPSLLYDFDLFMGALLC